MAMYFNDLSPYSYFLKRPLETVVNVGWLDATQPFYVAPVAEGVLRKLADICRSRAPVLAHVNKLRSVVACPICGRDRFDAVDPAGKLLVGMTELWIPNPKGGYFAAPSLVVHHIAEHGYSPPQSFQDAISAFDLTLPYDAQAVYLKSIAGAF